MACSDLLTVPLLAGQSRFFFYQMSRIIMSVRYQTVPRPNRRATVYFGTQLISGGIGPTSKKYLNVGPAKRPAFSGKSRFLPASPAFLREMSL